MTCRWSKKWKNYRAVRGSRGYTPWAKIFRSKMFMSTNLLFDLTFLKCYLFKESLKNSLDLDPSLTWKFRICCRIWFKVRDMNLKFASLFFCFLFFFPYTIYHLQYLVKSVLRKICNSFTLVSFPVNQISGEIMHRFL